MKNYVILLIVLSVTLTIKVGKAKCKEVGKTMDCKTDMKESPK